MKENIDFQVLKNLLTGKYFPAKQHEGELTQKDEEIMRLKGALEFYANKNNYDIEIDREGDYPVNYTVIERDNGKMARKVLGAEKNEEEI